MTKWLPRLVALIPIPVHAKLLAAFLVIVLLLLSVGAVALRMLGEVNHRAEELVRLQRKTAAYRQLQLDTTGQLYSVAAVLLVPNERIRSVMSGMPSLDAALRQLVQVGENLGRLPPVHGVEDELVGRLRADYRRFVGTATNVIQLIGTGRIDDARELQLTQAIPLAARLQRLTSELVSVAEANMVAHIAASHAAYQTARWVVLGFAIGTIALALILGYAISWSLSGAVKEMEVGLRQIATGDFSQQVVVPNRDELGALAADVNRMNRELRRLYDQLEAASRHKSEFLANMSHELRTPLNAVIGFSEVLLERMFGEVNPKQEEYLNDILSSGKHLLSLINDILDLSKIEAGQMELEVSDFDAPTALDNALTLMRERASRRGQVLERSIDSRLATIHADERKFKQVLLNLLSNAVKFTPEGGRIVVRAGVVDGMAEVSVVDSGIGIAAEDHETVFEEFRQVGQADKKAEGTGLGLALCRKFVELHGGRIWVKSQLGQGSTFTFTLPL